MMDTETKPDPKITVGIPVNNGESHITTAIESILAQTTDDWELVVCDNASTDGTQDIVEGFAARDARVRYLRNPTNLGAAANYNRCLEEARGRYFKWMAHDDWLSANYLEACAAVLDTEPDAVLAFGKPKEMLDEDTPYAKSTFVHPDWGDAGPVERFGLAMRLERTCHAIFGLYRREALERTTRHRPYYTSDRNLVAETALLGRFVPVIEATFYNRRHAGQSMARSTNRLYLNSWIDGSNNKKYSTMHFSRLAHFAEISGRYPDIAPRAALWRSAAGHLFSPRKLARYADEACEYVSPRYYGIVRGKAVKMLRSVRGERKYIET
jgi:glycosyltransferase involved in cell wall biosynthesis